VWGRWRRGAALAANASGRRPVKSRGASESAARKRKKVHGRLTRGVRLAATQRRGNGEVRRLGWLACGPRRRFRAWKCAFARGGLSEGDRSGPAERDGERVASAELSGPGRGGKGPMEGLAGRGVLAGRSGWFGYKA
jgi:hypothetical protein